MIGWILTYIYETIVYRALKGFKRWWTGQCELLRITLNEHNQGRRTLRVEKSMSRSHNASLREAIQGSNKDIDVLIAQIIVCKDVKVKHYPEFTPRMRTCLRQVIGYQTLQSEVESVRKTAYSINNSEHEALLASLWRSLKPKCALESRVGHQWSEIGFQGDDPSTDFRGMGLLGLKNLVFLSSHHSDVARHLLQHSYHPQFGYSFAIVGINLTSLAVKLLKDGALKTHFYSTLSDAPVLDDFQLVYVCLFNEFDKFWFLEEPENIMKFNSVKDKFTEYITERLNYEPLRLTTHDITTQH